MLQTSLVLLERRMTVITCERVTVLAFCTSLYQCIKFHLMPFYSFRDMHRPNFFIAKIKQGSNSVNTGDIVTILAFALPPMYRVSFNSLLYFQRYVSGKLCTAKIKRGNNSVNTGDRITFLAFCHFLHGPLSVYQVH